MVVCHAFGQAFYDQANVLHELADKKSLRLGPSVVVFSLFMQGVIDRGAQACCGVCHTGVQRRGKATL